MSSLRNVWPPAMSCISNYCDLVLKFIQWVGFCCGIWVQLSFYTQLGFYKSVYNQKYLLFLTAFDQSTQFVRMNSLVRVLNLFSDQINTSTSGRTSCCFGNQNDFQVTFGPVFGSVRFIDQYTVPLGRTGSFMVMF